VLIMEMERTLHSCMRCGYVGLARIIYIYIRFIYGIFGREITKYTAIYGVHIRFWPTLCICCWGVNSIVACLTILTLG
jgi:hypothetical protein